jgi:hypothetical protein
MRGPDTLPPEVQEDLDAMDAAVAGRPPEGGDAVLAELAVLLAGDRPEPDPAWVNRMDARATKGFAKSPAAPRRRRFTLRAFAAPAAGLAACALLALVIVFAGSGGNNDSESGLSGAGGSMSAGSESAGGGSSASTASPDVARDAGKPAPAPTAAGGSSSTAPTAALAPVPPAGGGPRSDRFDVQVDREAEVRRVADVGQVRTDRGEVRMPLLGEAAVVDVPCVEVAGALLRLEGVEAGVQGGVADDQVGERAEVAADLAVGQPGPAQRPDHPVDQGELMFASCGAGGHVVGDRGVSTEDRVRARRKAAQLVGPVVPAWPHLRERFAVQGIEHREQEVVLVPEMPVDGRRMRRQVAPQRLEGQGAEVVPAEGLHRGADDDLAIEAVAPPATRRRDGGRVVLLQGVAHRLTVPPTGP